MFCESIIIIIIIIIMNVFSLFFSHRFLTYSNLSGIL